MEHNNNSNIESLFEPTGIEQYNNNKKNLIRSTPNKQNTKERIKESQSN